jgi:hypothetical protein
MHNFIINFLKTQQDPEIRDRLRIYGPLDILILDNCSAHCGGTFTALCVQHRVVAIYLPPHSSHILQTLDLSIFGITKRLLSRANKMEKLNVQPSRIAGVVNSFMSAAVPHNIIQTFLRAGISLIVDQGLILCCIDAERIQSMWKSAAGSALPIPEVSQESDDEAIEEDLYLEVCAHLPSGSDEILY